MAGEVKRRLVHASGVVVPGAYLFDLLTWSQVQILLVLGAVIALALEVARLFGGLRWRIYDELTREYEQENVAGYALYAIGFTTTALAFRPTIAVPALLILSIADPISGLLSSRERRPAKRAYVILATFGVSTFIASLFVSPIPALLGAVAATLADGVKPVIAGYVIDDNLTIPIGSAVGISLGLQVAPLAGL